jgi:RND family efflux transporter MFP subunit
MVLRLAVWACMLPAALAAGCSKPAPSLAPPAPPVVTVEHPVERTLDSFTEFTGYLRAVEEQEIRAQVTGYLKKIHFSEGGIVKEGEPLYEIDPEPYDAALASAKASLAKAEADVLNYESQFRSAQTDFIRVEQMLATRSVSPEEFDRRKFTRDGADAALRSAKAAVDSARAAIARADFDRKNCVIRSEVKGLARVSRTQLTKGNLVTAGQSVLCRVTSLDPIYAYFDVDELTSLSYRRAIFDRKELPDPRQKGNELKCWVATKDEAGYPHAGYVDYIGPEIVRGTGTREVRGVIPNPGPQYRLNPGDSVRVRVVAGLPKKAVTVPEIAIGSQQRQKFVYVIAKGEGGEDVAQFRPVALGPVREVNGVRLQVVDSGVTPADRVVVNGLLRVRPGVPVTAKLQPPAMPAESSAVAGK